MSDAAVRFLTTSQLFISAAGRGYWAATRDDKLQNYKGRLLRFAKIVDKEYDQAVASGPPVTLSHKGDSGNVTVADSRRAFRVESGTLICVAAGAAILAGRLLIRQLSRRPQ